MENKNTIPDMTHPLGKAWEQPNKNDILIDDLHAVMLESTLNNLKNYSHSIPSGVYEGKMWRFIDREGINYLAWYSESDDPNKCSTNIREIILIN